MDTEITEETPIDLIEKKISAYIGVPVKSTDCSQFERFDGETVFVETFPFTEVKCLTIDNKEITDYIIDNKAGLIYLNQYYQGFLKLDYVAGLTEDEYSLYIEPLVKDILEYENDSGWTKNASSIKEGDVQINLDTSIGKGALIQKNLDDLKNRFNTYMRMI
ncbi:hypothetical protein [Methanobrevibacter sp.]